MGGIAGAPDAGAQAEDTSGPNESSTGTKVCVTGANGFIGKHLVRRLSERGYAVRVLTRKAQASFPRGVEVAVGDLCRDDWDLDGFVAGCDVLFHCAGEVGDPGRMRALHVDGTRRLIEAVRRECVRANRKVHWVQLSSCGAYGPPAGFPAEERIVREETPPRPANEYEITKTMADEMLIAACRDDRMSFSILRPSIVFGADMPNQALRKLTRMVKQERFFYLGRPGSIAPYVHVDDVIRALEALATERAARGRIYNLSNDCTFEALIAEIAALSNVRPPALRVPAALILLPLGLIRRLFGRWLRVPNLEILVSRTRYPKDRIEFELGFRCRMDMPGAIRDLVRN